jgi:hypothetical protein
MYKSTQHIQSTILLHLKNGVFMKAQGLNWNVISYSGKKPAKGVLVVASLKHLRFTPVYTGALQYRNTGVICTVTCPPFLGWYCGYLRVYSTYWATASTFPNLPVCIASQLPSSEPNERRNCVTKTSLWRDTENGRSPSQPYGTVAKFHRYNSRATTGSD